MLVLALLASLTSVSASSATPPILSEEVRGIVRSRHCVNCHSPERITAKPGALRVFDLSDSAWFARMNSRQLKVFEERLFADLTPAELKSMGADAKEKPLSADERGAVLRFVLERTAK